MYKSYIFLIFKYRYIYLAQVVMIGRIERNRECLETMVLKLKSTFISYRITIWYNKQYLLLDLRNNENIQHCVTYHRRKEVNVSALRPKR